jgi:uncharacterized membrane protein
VRQLALTVLGTPLAFAWLVAHQQVDRSAAARDERRSVALLMVTALAIKFVVVDTIFARLDAGGRFAATPIVNFQTFAAVVVAGGFALVRWATLKPDDESASLHVGLAATLVLLWAGTLEIDRLIASRAFPGVAVWPAWQLRQFAWSAWWTAGAIGYLAVATRKDPTRLRRLPRLRAIATIPALLAVKYMIVDTLTFRLAGRPASVTVGANLQTLAGAIVLGGAVIVWYWLEDGRLRRAASALAVVMLLWMGSFEIDRALWTSPMAEQLALSVFWSAFAIGCVAAGFAVRTAGLRYFGLALFALTLAKVGLIDLQNAQTGYRILSFLGLGGLLLATSVLYGKLSPVLLKDEMVAAG